MPNTACCRPIARESWITMFEDWFLAIGLSTSDDAGEFDARKVALLRTSLGAECYWIHSSMAINLCEGYADATKWIDRGPFWPQKQHRISACEVHASLTTCRRNYSQYVAALCEMPVSCRSADWTCTRPVDSTVLLQRIRERLLPKTATKTLNEFVNLAVTMKAPTQALTSVKRIPVNRVVPAASG